MPSHIWNRSTMIGLQDALKTIEVVDNIQLTGVLLDQLPAYGIRVGRRNGGKSPSAQSQHRVYTLGKRAKRSVTWR